MCSPAKHLNTFWVQGRKASATRPSEAFELKPQQCLEETRTATRRAIQVYSAKSKYREVDGACFGMSSRHASWGLWVASLRPETQTQQSSLVGELGLACALCSTRSPNYPMARNPESLKKNAKQGQRDSESTINSCQCTFPQRGNRVHHMGVSGIFP